MMTHSSGSLLHKLTYALVPVLILIFSGQHITAQTTPATTAVQPGPPAQILKLDRTEVPGGAELITIHARLDGLDSDENKWVPLISVLRDTLGDSNPENDRLRYVWPLTYTRPTARQRIAAAIPFLYTHIGNKSSSTLKPPPPAFDMASPESEVWNKIFWTALQNILLDSYGTPIKASTSSYRRNVGDYRRAHLIQALSVLTLYQAVKGDAAFSDRELAEIQARLMLSEKTFGGLVDEVNLENYYAKETIAVKDFRGHNWELLRQRAEAESLYFEPLVMPDGSATHALLWVAKSDLLNRPRERYNGRFLNIANPWSDKRLLNWHGYVATRYQNSNGEIVEKEAPDAHRLELIPLALYGLDNPKIPMLLVDFRDGYNPKKREMSRRVLNDITRNVLSVSSFGNLPFFLGRTVFDFVTGRRGIDINQPSRIQTYSQLKLLLALSNSLDPELREEIGGRLERLTLNPFENDFATEARLARQQYSSLQVFARDPNGLARKLDADRRAELTPLEHGTRAQLAFRILNVLTFGKYVHRENASEDIEERLDVARTLNYHTKFLEQVARSKAEIDVAWNLDEVRRSLNYLATHAGAASERAVSATGKIFFRTRDDETRKACLESLSRIPSQKARTELLRISQNTAVDQSWREIADAYLNQKSAPTQPVANNSSVRVGQP